MLNIFREEGGRALSAAQGQGRSVRDITVAWGTRGGIGDPARRACLPETRGPQPVLVVDRILVTATAAVADRAPGPALAGTVVAVYFPVREDGDAGGKHAKPVGTPLTASLRHPA